MRRILAAVVALSFLMPAFAAQPKQQLRPGEEIGEPGEPVPVNPPGSAVLVPPLIVAGDTSPAAPMKVLRLPVEAGRVTKMVATNLVENSKSWIAKGHKYYSLCMPNGSKISCTPIVSTATMKDIDVGAYADENGSPKLSFTIDPATTQEPKRLIAAINYFLGRAATQTAHFNQKKSANTPLKTRPGGVAAPTIEGEGNGMVCTFNEFGGVDCTGGDGGSSGDGYESEDEEDFDWEEEVEASETALESAPSYPSGSSNGNGNPCIDSGGNDICGPQIVITGRLPDPPQQAALPTCVATPWAIACSPRPPPVLIDPTEQLPRGPQPWLPQGACNAWGVLCSGGQIPEEAPPPVTTDEKRSRERMQCYARANASLTTCHDLRKNLGEDWFATCKRNAFDQGSECDVVGMDR